MNRDDGYYWVKFHGIWIVAEAISDKWLIHGREYRYNDTQFDKIYENRITLPFCVNLKD